MLYHDTQDMDTQLQDTCSENITQKGIFNRKDRSLLDHQAKIYDGIYKSRNNRKIHKDQELIVENNIELNKLT